jgi:hypothetical protein
MADSSLIQVVVPALIGLGGTVVGSAIVFTSQWLLERKKQEADKKKKKAEKLEELVTILFEYEDWIHTTDINRLDPGAKLQAIQKVYFPEFANLTIQLQARIIEYHVIQDKKEERNDKAIEALNAYLTEIENYAKREFQ